MPNPELPPEFLAFLATVTGKRSRVVVQHILEHGFITTEDLETVYHYSHPPRAIRDVREQGVPIETFTLKNRAGRSIAAYRFGDPSRIQPFRAGGRRGNLRQIKLQLISISGPRCFLCSTGFEAEALQVDHRIPYSIGGDPRDPGDISAYMLVCRPCNRAKSWACEHCDNWHNAQDRQICAMCYWAAPEDYAHIAMQPLRRVELTWAGDQIAHYEALQARAAALGLTLRAYILQRLREISADEG
jgi:5-methylcytosine-specific restriction endonuclease McrA